VPIHRGRPTCAIKKRRHSAELDRFLVLGLPCKPLPPRIPFSALSDGGDECRRTPLSVFRMPFRSLSDDRIRICSTPHGARALPTTVCVTFERKQKRRWCRKPKIEGSRGVHMTWRDVA